MKCPKCSFISFDYNQVCPKCGHDLSLERDLMSFPSYKPKPLSLLGVLTGDGEVPEMGAPMGSSGASGMHGADTQELLISLDSLSDEDQEPIQPEPEPSSTGRETEIGKGAEAADEEFAISLDDLSDEGTEIVLFDPETEATALEGETADEIFFETEISLSEDAGPKKEGFWESEALDPGAANMQLDDASKKEGVALNKGDAPGGGKEDEPDLFELELEPLELDIEIEESDKKTS
ncbi:MAG: hypothetical protein R6X27_06250 [Candidatus Desulfacyla sp.]